MDRLRNIEIKMEEKMRSLPRDVSIVRPENNPSADIQADWLISLLSRMYTEHGITKRRNQLVEDIQKGKSRVWFAIKKGEPIASAALVDQSDGSVEVGRAVSMENGVGGLLMLMAAKEHLENSVEQLVAEVRVSDEYEGIPSGQATQKICLNQIGLTPHALVPAFNHGKPIRQEAFLFSSSRILGEAEPMAVPDNCRAKEVLEQTAVALTQKRFLEKLTLESIPDERNQKYDIVKSAPFSVMVPSKTGCQIEKTIKAAELNSAFTLTPVETSSENTGAVLECLNQGFVPCGIDRQLGPNGRPVLMLGKLRQDTLYAPIKILKDSIQPEEEAAVNKIDQIFRRRLNGRP